MLAIRKGKFWRRFFVERVGICRDWSYTRKAKLVRQRTDVRHIRVQAFGSNQRRRTRWWLRCLKKPNGSLRLPSSYCQGGMEAMAVDLFGLALGPEFGRSDPTMWPAQDPGTPRSNHVRGTLSIKWWIEDLNWDSVWPLVLDKRNSKIVSGKADKPASLRQFLVSGTQFGVWPDHLSHLQVVIWCFGSHRTDLKIPMIWISLSVFS